MNVFVGLDSANVTTPRVSFYQEIVSDEDEKYSSPSPSPSPLPPTSHPHTSIDQTEEATEQSNPTHGIQKNIGLQNGNF